MTAQQCGRDARVGPTRARWPLGHRIRPERRRLRHRGQGRTRRSRNRPVSSSWARPRRPGRSRPVRCRPAAGPATRPATRRRRRRPPVRRARDRRLHRPRRFRVMREESFTEDSLRRARRTARTNEHGPRITARRGSVKGTANRVARDRRRYRVAERDPTRGRTASSPTRPRARPLPSMRRLFRRLRASVRPRTRRVGRRVSRTAALRCPRERARREQRRCRRDRSHPISPLHVHARWCERTRRGRGHRSRAQPIG